MITVPKTPALILDKTGNHNVSLYAGTRLPALETTADGFKVQFPDNTRAVIGVSDARPDKPVDPVINDVAPADLAGTAKKFLGVRHLAGGLSAQGMDTRGLVYLVYRIHGIVLDKDRAALKARAVRVRKKELLPGDILVFFGEGEGLSLGGGYFLHAPKKPRSRPAASTTAGMPMPFNTDSAS